MPPNWHKFNNVEEVNHCARTLLAHTVSLDELEGISLGRCPQAHDFEGGQYLCENEEKMFLLGVM